MTNPPPLRIGISGTGFIARGLFRLLSSMPDRYCITGVLTRRATDDLFDLPEGATRSHSATQLCANCDVVFECSGHVGPAAHLVQTAFAAGLPVVTMNAEFQATVGVAFSGRGTLLEAAGDQPGSIAALADEARLMGFQPLVYGSQKGFLNHNPSAGEMTKWARIQGISLGAVTSFTDGTKVQIEQALVANAMDAEIAKRGLVGPSAESLENCVSLLAQTALEAGQPLSDYALVPAGKGDVFVAATHPSPTSELAYYKMGPGPVYLLRRPYHLGHFEVPVTLARLASGLPPLLPAVNHNRISVAAVAKRDIPSGTRITRAIGTFDFRGEAVRTMDEPDHLPIGLMEDCRTRNALFAGQTVAISDIDIDDALAFDLWQGLR